MTRIFSLWRGLEGCRRNRHYRITGTSSLALQRNMRENVSYRKPRATSYREELPGKVAGFLVHLSNREHTDITVEFLQQAILSPHECNCPIWSTESKKKLPWCSPQLQWLHRETEDCRIRPEVLTAAGGFAPCESQYVILLKFHFTFYFQYLDCYVASVPKHHGVRA
jgi:hypothetical protein